MNSIKLKGITWGHTRGFVPLVATGQRFSELHPGLEVQWEKRSLQAFADQSVQALAQEYDLLVIDHPSIGEAQEKQLFLPLDAFLTPQFLADQAQHSVGASHASYQYAGHQWALAIDAATPVSAARLDVLKQAGHQVPQSWDALIDLAQAGLVAFAGLKLDCLMHFYTLCVAEGQEPFTTSDSLVDPDVAAAALTALHELTKACGPECLTRNPIAVYEMMTKGDRHGYSPFAYGYSNYARASYVDKPLVFGGLIKRNGRRLTSTLGGCGLAVSAQSKHQDLAIQYAEYVASERIQTGLFTEMGGQPGHRAAWLATGNNQRSNNYFINTLKTLDEAYVRPRYNGYIHFQEQAPEVVERFLLGQEGLRKTIEDLDALDKTWRQGRVNEQLHLSEVVS
jgi:multiple sugar transport system substrate-binding protein